MKNISRQKKLMTICFVLLGMMSFAGDPLVDSEAKKSDTGESKSEIRVTVYYFHDNFRCKTCRAMERLSQQAIREEFADELKNGSVVWKVINTDEPKYAHFKKDYQLFTKSLIVVREEKGKQPVWKNCPKIWELVWKETEFKKYVVEQVHASIEGR